MEFRDIIREMIKDFFFIYTGCMFGTFFFCKAFYPDVMFDVNYFAWMALFAFMGDLPMLVFYSPKELSGRQALVRMVIHFALLEAVLMSMAAFLGLYSTVFQAVAFFFVIMAVYVMVRAMTFRQDSRMADSVNQRIREIKGAK